MIHTYSGCAVAYNEPMFKYRHTFILSIVCCAVHAFQNSKVVIIAVMLSYICLFICLQTTTGRSPLTAEVNAYIDCIYRVGQKKCDDFEVTWRRCFFNQYKITR